MVQIGLKVAELLCSRLCHDLVGPAGAVNAGIELLVEGGVPPEEAAALAGQSGRQLADRLGFFRSAFGHGGGEGPVAVAELVKLSRAYLQGGKVTLDSPPQPEIPNLAKSAGRLLLNLILLGVESLPRGGTLHLGVERSGGEVAVVVEAGGAGAVFRPDLAAALGASDESALTARNVQAYFTACLCRALAGRLNVETPAPERVRLSAAFPAGRAIP